MTRSSCRHPCLLASREACKGTEETWFLFLCCTNTNVCKLIYYLVCCLCFGSTNKLSWFSLRCKNILPMSVFKVCCRVRCSFNYDEAKYGRRMEGERRRLEAKKRAKFFFAPMFRREQRWLWPSSRQEQGLIALFAVGCISEPPKRHTTTCTSSPLSNPSDFSFNRRLMTDTVGPLHVKHAVGKLECWEMTIPPKFWRNVLLCPDKRWTCIRGFTYLLD